jgi:hypothetical protein
VHRGAGPRELNGPRLAEPFADASTEAPSALDLPLSFRSSGSDETNLLATKSFLAELTFIVERRRFIRTSIGA